MEPSTSLSDLLRRHRAAAGLTQEELAEKAGVSARGISDLERGVERRPYKATLTHLADALDLTGEERELFMLAARGTARPVGAGSKPAAVTQPTAEAGTRMRRRHSLWWLLLGAALVAGLAVALIVTRPGAGTGAPPSFSQTPAGLRAKQLIRAAVRASDLAFRRSVSCPCDRSLETVKTGPDLQKYLQQVRQLRRSGERIVITPHTFRVDSIDLPQASEAYARVSKDETIGLYRHKRLIQVCVGPYRVRYHLVQAARTWKVDDTSILGGSQTCHTV